MSFSRSGAPRTAGGRLRRLTARVATIGTIAAGSSALLTGVALAWHADISAKVDCAGVVDYTATAWQTSDASQRVNPSIGVGYALNDDSITTWDAANGAFDATDD